MCLIAFNWQPESAERLLLAANRDEFYARPTVHCIGGTAAMCWPGAINKPVAHGWA